MSGAGDDTRSGKAGSDSPTDLSGKGMAGFKGTDMEKDTTSEYQAKESFRTDIGKGTWAWAGYHLATTIATPAAYAYLPFAFAGLGWGPGMVALLMGIGVTWYASVLLASLHEWNGVRYVRYRDVAFSISGKWASYAVVFFQQIASLGNNITLGIFAGISMKALNQSFDSNSGITLQQFIIIFGCIQLVLSQFPTIHDLRLLNMICTICTLAFAISATALSIYSGYNPPEGSEPVSYDVVGSTATKVFGIFSALGTIAFGFGDTILPEIQATLREPVKWNMYKAVALCYSVISVSYIIVTVAGYWGFGNAVLPYLPGSFVGPTWAVRMSEFFALLQVVGCYQIYCRPTYEVAEDYLMDRSQGPLAPRNMVARFVITTAYVAILTTIGCAMPFFGDFLALCGAIGFTPLDFIMPLILWNGAHRGMISTPRKLFHWAVIILYTIVGVVACVGAMRGIINNSINYSLFADI